jgi:hypothetical protein
MQYYFSNDSGDSYFTNASIVFNDCYYFNYLPYSHIVNYVYLTISGESAPTFEEGKYYSKSGDTYTLLSEEPLDWSESYTNYYTRSISYDLNVSKLILNNIHEGTKKPMITINRLQHNIAAIDNIQNIAVFPDRMLGWNKVLTYGFNFDYPKSSLSSKYKAFFPAGTHIVGFRVIKDSCWADSLVARNLMIKCGNKIVATIEETDIRMPLNAYIDCNIFVPEEKENYVTIESDKVIETGVDNIKVITYYHSDVGGHNNALQLPAETQGKTIKALIGNGTTLYTGTHNIAQLLHFVDGTYEKNGITFVVSGTKVKITGTSTDQSTLSPSFGKVGTYISIIRDEGHITELPQATFMFKAFVTEQEDKLIPSGSIYAGFASVSGSTHLVVALGNAGSSRQIINSVNLGYPVVYVLPNKTVNCEIDFAVYFDKFSSKTQELSSLQAITASGEIASGDITFFVGDFCEVFE